MIAWTDAEDCSTGLNALKALDELGILKPIMEKADDKKTLRSFNFVSGYGQHEVVYNVSRAVCLPLDVDLMQR